MTEEKQRLFAAIPARTIAALADFIKDVQDYSHGMHAHCNQRDTARMGLYVIPKTAGGIECIVTDGVRLVSVFEPEGKASAALKLYLPDKMLAATKPRMISLLDENGQPFERAMEPTPKWVHCNNLFGMVSVDHSEPWQAERFPGVLGTWENGDHGNVIAACTYRIEAAAIGWLMAGLDGLRDGNCVSTLSVTLTLRIDFGLLGTLARCAEAYGNDFTMRFGGTTGAIRIESADRQFFASIMPLAERGPSENE